MSVLCEKVARSLQEAVRVGAKVNHVQMHNNIALAVSRYNDSGYAIEVSPKGPRHYFFGVPAMINNYIPDDCILIVDNEYKVFDRILVPN